MLTAALVVLEVKRVTVVGTIAGFSGLGRVPLSNELIFFWFGTEKILVFNMDELLLEPDLGNFRETGGTLFAYTIDNFDYRFFIIFLTFGGSLNIDIKASAILKVEQFLCFDSPTDNIRPQAH